MVAFLAACGEEPLPSRGERRAPISGVVVDEGCTSFEIDRIDLAMLDLMDGDRGINSNGLKACLKEAVFSTEPWVSPEMVIWALKQDVPTKVICQDNTKMECGGKTGWWDGCATIGGDKESLWLSKSMLNDPNAAPHYIASVILHEVVHTKGFAHMDGTYEYDYSVVKQVMKCFDNGVPAGRRRSDMSVETQTAHVGGGGGHPFSLRCPGAQFGFGMKGTADSMVNSVELRCMNFSGTSALGTAVSALDETTAVGAAGQTSGDGFAEYCKGTEVMTGVWGKADVFINKVGPRCSNYADVKNGVTTLPRELPLAGGNAGTYFTRDCPKGMAVKRLRGRAALRIDQLSLECVRVASVVAAGGWNPNVRSQVFGTKSEAELDFSVGGKQAKYRPHYEFKCMGQGVMSGLYGLASGEVMRLGGKCVGTDRVNGIYRLQNGETALPATLGWTGTAFQDACPSKMAIAGVEVRSGARVDAIQAKCVTVEKWLDPTKAAAAGDWAWLPQHGGGGGSVSYYQCPKGWLVAGFETWSGTDANDTYSVHGLRVICR
jgi:hypothetical protein